MRLEDRVARANPGHQNKTVLVSLNLVGNSRGDFRLHIQLRPQVRQEVVVVDRTFVLKCPVEVIGLSHFLNHQLVEIDT